MLLRSQPSTDSFSTIAEDQSILREVEWKLDMFSTPVRRGGADLCMYSNRMWHLYRSFVPQGTTARGPPPQSVRKLMGNTIRSS